MAVRLRRRLLGLLFLGLMGLASWLAYADYRHAFDDDLTVTARLTGTGGLLLDPEADVKMRGVVVGRVADVRTGDGSVTARLALDRDRAGSVPAGVRARLLPTTLFGAAYVDLVPDGSGARPADASAVGVQDGDVLAPDRSARTRQVQRVLADVYPLLRTLRPAELNATLYAVSHALEGRGEAVGANLGRVDAYLRGLTPHLDRLTADAGALGEVSDTYADATPDLARVLRNLAVTNRTLSTHRDTLDAFVTGLTGTATVAEATLAENESNLVRLAGVSRPGLELLARYSPEYPCLLAGLAHYDKPLSQAFGGGQPALHITLEAVRQRAKYDQGEYPAYVDRRGPRCQELPRPSVPARLPHGGPVADGSDGPEDYEGTVPASPPGAGDVGRLLTSSLRGGQGI